LKGASFPVQSVLLGKFLETFQSIDNLNEFERRANFWALMFFVLAIGVGVFYFMMGSMFTSIQYVCVSILKPEIIGCNVDIIEPYNLLPSGIFPKCAPPGYSVFRFRRELCWVLNIKTK
jgi:hypothetical protein